MRWVARSSASRAVSAFLAVALVAAGSTPGRGDDTPAHSLQQIDALQRAIQNSRQASDRYRQAPALYQNAAAAASERIAEYAAQQQAASTEAEGLAARIAIAEEQLALMSFQMEETVADLAALDRTLEENQRGSNSASACTPST